MSFKDDLESYMKASYPALYISTYEELRIAGEIYEWFKDSHTIYIWDSLVGLSQKLEGAKTKNVKDTTDPVAMLACITNICQQPGQGGEHIYILKDFHLQFDNPLKKIQVIRAFKNTSNYLKAVGSIALFISPIVKLPVEISKDIQLLDYALPNEEAIESQLDFVHKSVNESKKGKEKLEIDDATREMAIEAAKGMTDSEVENAFSLAIVRNKAFNGGFVKSVFKEKIQQVKKAGILTYLETNVTFDNVGGLDGVKSWMAARKGGFTKKAREYGLPFPKGVGLAGIAGCGKTLISKAIANELGFPLFQLDIGKLFSKWVGETEQNFADMIKTVESIGRCVLQLDEIEKYLNTSAVSGSGDSGTGSRSFGSVLTWLSDRDSPAFIIATSNNHLILPVELIRKGRFDEWFWIDLPEQKEREDIFNVVIRKFKRNPEKFDIPALAMSAEKFTGAEIDNVFKDAMFRAFNEGKEVNEDHVIKEIELVTPQAVINEDRISAMRNQVEGRLRVASTFANPAELVKARKIKT
ncbi:AAA family ATPase [Acinetobacter sp.]|uniref:AAA family ATPase n=1 Tax=Acinetobacter sp. TaxID=472 RepID=UPI003751C584